MDENIESIKNILPIYKEMIENEINDLEAIKTMKNDLQEKLDYLGSMILEDDESYDVEYQNQTQANEEIENLQKEIQVLLNEVNKKIAEIEEQPEEGEILLNEEIKELPSIEDDFSEAIDEQDTLEDFSDKDVIDEDKIIDDQDVIDEEEIDGDTLIEELDGLDDFEEIDEVEEFDEDIEELGTEDEALGELLEGEFEPEPENEETENYEEEFEEIDDVEVENEEDFESDNEEAEKDDKDFELEDGAEEFDEDIEELGTEDKALGELLEGEFEPEPGNKKTENYEEGFEVIDDVEVEKSEGNTYDMISFSYSTFGVTITDPSQDYNNQASDIVKKRQGVTVGEAGEKSKKAADLILESIEESLANRVREKNTSQQTKQTNEEKNKIPDFGKDEKVR